MSDAAIRLQGEIIGQPNGPQRLYDAWTTGEIVDNDLRSLIPDTWTRCDQPEQIIGASCWVPMFRAAGQLVLPTNLPTPTYPLKIYRAAPEARRHGMAWAPDIQVAAYFRQRCEHFHETAVIYQATVRADAVLAIFNIKRPEHEIVVDPQLLGPVDPTR